MKKEIGKIPVFRMAFKIYIGWALAKGLSNVLNMYCEILFRYLKKRQCDGSDFGNIVDKALKLAGYEQKGDEKIKNKCKMGFEFK